MNKNTLLIDNKDEAKVQPQKRLDNFKVSYATSSLKKSEILENFNKSSFDLIIINYDNLKSDLTDKELDFLSNAINITILIVSYLAVLLLQWHFNFSNSVTESFLLPLTVRDSHGKD